MSTTFETVSSIAIREIIIDQCKEMKFGYLMTEESLDSICQELTKLLVTSRELKSAGDRFLHMGPVQQRKRMD